MAVAVSRVDPQEKVLAQWEQQKEQWRAFNDKMARRSQRHPDETLAGGVWKYREKMEELDVLDASVPQAAKSGNIAWEMSLRDGAAGAGGIRYVRTGGTYPYPLYCPVKDRDHLPPQSNTFLRVITKDGQEANEALNRGERRPLRRAVDTAYYKQRERYFRRYIERKFAHRLQGSKEAFSVFAVPPAYTADLDASRTITAPTQDGLGGVVMYPPPPGSPPQKSITSPSTAVVQVVEESTTGAPRMESIDRTDDDDDDDEQQDDKTPPSGPSLLVASNRLTFNTEPSILTQSSLRISNAGTTAVYFTWRRLEPDSIVPRQQSVGPHFTLSDIPTGALLPEEERYFTFAFRQENVGVYTEDWEMLTIPRGIARIVIRLRGCVTCRDGDPLRRQSLENRMQHRIAEAAMQRLFADMLEAPVEINQFDATDIRRQEEEHKAEEAKKVEIEEARRAAQAESWKLRNVGTPFHHHMVLYDRFEQLHGNVQRYVKVTGDPPGTGVGWRQGDGMVINVPPWDGSLAVLAEEIQHIGDADVRHDVFTGYSDLVRAATVDPVAVPEISELAAKRGYRPLIGYRSLYDGLLLVIDQYVDRSHALQVQLGLIEEQTDAHVKGRGKDRGKKKEEPKKKVPVQAGKQLKKKTQQDELATPDEEDVRRNRMEIEYKEKCEADVKSMLEDCLYQWMSQVEATETRQAAVVEQSLLVTYTQRIAAQEEHHKLTLQLQAKEKEAAEKERQLQAQQAATQQGTSSKKANQQDGKSDDGTHHEGHRRRRRQEK